MIMKRYLQTSVLIMACVLPVAVSVCTFRTVIAAESAAAKDNLEKLKATKSCRGCDLAGLILNRLDLVDADLEGADLSSAKLSLTNLTRANLKNTNLRGTVFGGTDLSDADLRGADLRGTSLDSSYYKGARFDGEFIAAKPYEEVGETEVAKEVFVADPVKPKQNPETREVKVSDRSDQEASPSTIAAVREVKPEAVPVKLQEVPKDRKSPDPASLAPPPAAKKVAPVQQAIVDVSAQDENIATAHPALPVPLKEEIIKPVPVEAKIAVPVARPTVNVPEQNIKAAASVTTPQPPTRVEAKKGPEVEPGTTISAKASKSEKVNEEKPIIESGGVSQSQKPPAGKNQQDNLARLLDKNRCYGCDLSGLDLSGKDLDGADLEKANLTGCNLEKVGMDKANLKSALLVKANLRQANLKNADFYKADLSGADLTGAKVAGATFDSAQTASAVGLKEAIGAAGK